MKSAERCDLAKTKQTESLAEYLFTHIIKYRVIILKEVAHVARNKESLVRSHKKSYCPRLEHIYLTKRLKRKMIRKIRANYLDGICERYKTNLQIPDSLDTCEKLNQIFQTRRISLVFRRGSSRNLVPRVRVACVAG